MCNTPIWVLALINMLLANAIAAMMVIFANSIRPTLEACCCISGRTGESRTEGHRWEGSRRCFRAWWLLARMGSCAMAHYGGTTE